MKEADAEPPDVVLVLFEPEAFADPLLQAASRIPRLPSNDTTAAARTRLPTLGDGPTECDMEPDITTGPCRTPLRILWVRYETTGMHEAGVNGQNQYSENQYSEVNTVAG